MATIVSNATAAEVAKALGIVARRKVVYTASVGDAAAPVMLMAGPYTQQIGQVADYRHEISDAAERNDALLVSGWYDETHGWVASIADEYADAVVDHLRPKFRATTIAAIEAADRARAKRIQAEMAERERTRPEREAQAAAYRAECDARREEYRPLYEAALGRVRTNRRGEQHRGDLNKLQWAYDGACRGYDHDREYALRHLTRYAELGFDDSENPAITA